MTKVATRFAPSPTGPLHIGGVRTALFNWLYSKNQKGDFYLRVEDTDKERSKDEYKDQIVKSLKWIGINYDGEEYTFHPDAEPSEPSGESSTESSAEPSTEPSAEPSGEPVEPPFGGQAAEGEE